MRKKMAEETIIFDDQYHHITFSLDGEDNILVYLDGVRIDKAETKLAIEIFKQGIYFKFQPLPDLREGLSPENIRRQTKKMRKEIK